MYISYYIICIYTPKVYRSDNKTIHSFTRRLECSKPFFQGQQICLPIDVQWCHHCLKMLDDKLHMGVSKK